MRFTLWVPGLAMALAGCHSLPAPHYYALDAVHPVSAASHSTLPFLIRVRHVDLPHEIDRLGLTHHLGPTELAISDTERWTAPLNVLIQGTLTRDLGERLGYEHVVAIDALALAPHPMLTSAALGAAPRLCWMWISCHCPRMTAAESRPRSTGPCQWPVRGPPRYHAIGGSGRQLSGRSARGT